MYNALTWRQILNSYETKLLKMAWIWFSYDIIVFIELHVFKFRSIRVVMLASYKAKECTKTVLVTFWRWFLVLIKILMRDWLLSMQLG